MRGRQWETRCAACPAGACRIKLFKHLLSAQIHWILLFEASLIMRLHVQLFQAFDAAVRGLSLGETTTLEAKGGEWRRDLLFEVLALPMHTQVPACHALTDIAT